MEFLSTKQIAEQLGVSKQRVYRCIKKHCIKEAHSEVVNGNTVLMYDNEAFNTISEALKGLDGTHHEAHHEAHHESHNDILHEALVKQLEEKDKQIQELIKSLNEAHQLLHQEQQLHAKKVMELENKVQTINQEQNQEVEEPVKKKSWLQKLFSI